MANLKYFDELPDKVVSKSAKRDYTSLIEYTEQYLNTELRQAIEAEGLAFTVDIVNMIADGSKLQAYINKEKTAFLSGRFIPTQEKKRIEESYQEVYKRLQMHSANLEGAFHKANAPLKKQGDQIVFDSATVQANEDAIGNFIFTKKDREYWALLDELSAKIREVSAWEKTNGYASFAGESAHVTVSLVPPYTQSAEPFGLCATISGDRQMTPEQLAWLRGFIAR